MAKRDYYEVLGVGRDAAPDELKRQFRRLAAKYHPDANPGNAQAEEQFKEINEAYQILSDPEKRARYDQFGHQAAQAGGGADFGGFSGFGDIIDMFFGGNGPGGRQGGPQRGPDLRYDLTIELEDVLEGVEKEIRMVRDETCPHCRGNQAEPGTRLETCPQCRGTGQVERIRESFLGRVRQVETCSRCRGGGRIVHNPCTQCAGRGQVRAEKTLTVKVPPGVDDGTRLRVAGEGGVGQHGGQTGDLIVFLRVKEKPGFARDGDDLWSEMSIGFAQAALGCDVKVAGLKGEESLHIPPGTQNEAVFKISKMGLPRLGNPASRGNLNVRVRITVPTHLTAREREVLHMWAEMRQEEVLPPDKGILRKVKDALGR